MIIRKPTAEVEPASAVTTDLRVSHVGLLGDE